MIRLLLTFFSLFAFGKVTLAEPLPLSKEYWQSETFLNQFNGSYRINAMIEPLLSSEERGLLLQVQDFMAKGQREQAAKALQTSPLLKSSAALQFNLANILSETDDLDKAITYYRLALDRLPAFQRAHQNIAFAYFRKDQAKEAKKHLLEAVRLGANGGSVHGLLGYCFLQQENYQPALRSFREALITQPEEKDWKLGIGQALQNLNRSDEALTLYQELNKKHPDDEQLILQLALIHNERDELAKATTLLELLRRRDALPTPYHFLLGTLLISHGNSQIGTEILLETLQDEKFKEPDLAINSIQYCFRQGLTDAAFKMHQLIQVNHLSAKGKIAHKRLHAIMLLSKQDSKQQGVKILKELIKANPLDSHSLFLLGQQSVFSKKPHEALIIFEQAAHAEGSHSAAANLEKAKTLVTLQDYENAIAAIDLYLKSHPNDERVSDYRTQLTKLVRAQNPAKR